MKIKQFCKFLIAIPLSNFYQVGKVHGQNVDVCRVVLMVPLCTANLSCCLQTVIGHTSLD
jgi:hypothetical protein